MRLGGRATDRNGLRENAWMETGSGGRGAGADPATDDDPDDCRGGAARHPESSARTMTMETEELFICTT
jgi:hypothetical protein